MDERVSVIIPTLNEEKYIGKCIYALLKQTVKPFEIIVVDKYSTDKTREIARKFGTKIILEKGGILDAKMIGVKNAKGDWILLIDADTLLIDKNWIKKALITAKIKKADFVVGFVKPVGNFSEKLTFLLWNFLSLLLKILTSKNFFAGPFCFFVKREKIAKIKVPKSVKIFDDVILSFLLSKKCRVKRCFHCFSVTSARRMRKMGYLNFWLYWLINFFKFLKKGIIREEFLAIR